MTFAISYLIWMGLWKCKLTSKGHKATGLRGRSCRHVLCLCNTFKRARSTVARRVKRKEIGCGIPRSRVKDYKQAVGSWDLSPKKTINIGMYRCSLKVLLEISFLLQLASCLDDARWLSLNAVILFIYGLRLRSFKLPLAAEVALCADDCFLPIWVCTSLIGRLRCKGRRTTYIVQ